MADNKDQTKGSKSLNANNSMGDFGHSASNATPDIEVVQRSGLFGQVLNVERQSVHSVKKSIRMDASYRSAATSISHAIMSSQKTADGVVKYDKQPAQHATWMNIAAIMLSEIVGAGVMALSAKYAQLGWALATFFIVAMFPLLVYTSFMMVSVKKVFPAIVSLPDAGDYCFGKWGRRINMFYLIIFLTSTLGDYLLLVGKTLGSAVYGVHLCLPIWMLIAFAVILPITQLRTLNSAATICFVNLAAILIVIAIVIAQLAKDGRVDNVVTEVVADGLDFATVMKALSSIFFAYGGQFMFYELMAEMKDFTDFPKTFTIAGPFQVGVYLLVGIVGYYYKGVNASGFFLDNLPFGPMFRAASAIFFFHICVSFLVLGHVLARVLHIWVAPRHVNDLGWKGSLQWFGCTSAVCIVSYVIANSIPFFDSLTGLIGGFTIPVMSLMMPVMCYMRTRHMTGQKLKIWEWVVYITIIAFALLVTVCSTIFNIEEIVQNWSTFGAPFACHCEEIWKTCECSPGRMNFLEEICPVAGGNGTMSG